METVSYDAPSTGAIGLDGTVTAWPVLEDGDYDVLLWRSGGQVVEEATITITDGKATPVGAVFCLRTTNTETLTFKAARVTLNEEAEVEVEGVEFPLDENGVSLFADGFDDPARWEIEGAISP
jgi:hypothetical protein